ncbi:MAG: ATP-binding protein [Bacteroidota bacterium]
MNSLRRQLFLWLKPKHRRLSAEEHMKVLTFVDALWIGSIPVFIIFPILFYFSEFKMGLWCSLHSIPYLLAIIWVLRTTANFVWLAHTVAVSVFNSITPIAILSGGMDSPVIILYLMAIPVVFDMGGSKWGLRWSIIYGILLALLFVIDTWWYPFPDYFQNKDTFSFLFVAFLAFAVFLVLYNNQWAIAHEDLLQEITRQEKLLNEQEKMASIGQLMAGIAHEVNNPLNYIKNGASALRLNLLDFQQITTQLQQLPAPTEEPELVKLQALIQQLDLPALEEETLAITTSINSGVERIGEITMGLRYMAYSDKDEKESVNIHDDLRVAVTMLHSQYNGRIEIAEDFRAEPYIQAYPGKLSQVFLNIISNAIQAIDGPGIIYLRTYSDNTQMRIQIEDTGNGISEAVRSRIFDPFFTTKEVGKGTGLGLSITFEIISAHDGTISVSSKEGKGTCFEITLPQLL